MSNFDFDAADNTAQDAIQFSAPTIFWKHGKKAMEQLGGINFTGGFFFTFEQAGDSAEIPKWSKSSFVNDDGKTIEGLAAQGARIAIVRSRRRWFKDDGNRKIFRPWNRYEDGFRGQMQSIGFVSGYTAPVCFSVKGLLLTHFDEIIRYHNSKVVSLANQTAPEGKKLPSYAFWMVVQAGKHSKAGQGNKQSEVTMPELWLPKTLSVDYAHEVYVGREQLLRSQALYRELDDWATQWNSLTTENAEQPLGADDYAVEQEARRSMSAAAGSSQSQDRGVEADEIPFN